MLKNPVPPVPHPVFLALNNPTLLKAKKESISIASLSLQELKGPEEMKKHPTHQNPMVSISPTTLVSITEPAVQLVRTIIILNLHIILVQTTVVLVYANLLAFYFYY